MAKIKFEIMMEVDDNFTEEAKTWEHHAEALLDLDEYPEIKSVYGCQVMVEKECEKDAPDNDYERWFWNKYAVKHKIGQ